eukprot:TRINITY_DN1482_c0_g2_i1.p1 TRINITY_DN1482_c0_g2~~TRINITY_DN1482_c0_g2_i1.p1  ORF type:complete len:348 (+),score=92.24 TRINITY_DN1482_c0_g2_i1:179-1222(+)
MNPEDASIEELISAAEAVAANGSAPAGGDGGSPPPAAARQRRPEAPQSGSQQNARTNKDGQTYTTDQMKEVQTILRTKDYYEILRVSKDASEDEIKKAYKKLALKLHPDKNKAPGAEEAFKKVSKAVQCLTDEEKKQVYDRYGDEERVPQQHRRHYNDDFMDAQELFTSMFFGGVSHGHGHGFRGGHGGHGEHGEARQAPPPRQQLTQVLAFIVIIIMMFTSNLTTRDSQSVFSFTRTDNFEQERTTANIRVRYYVGNDFEDHYPDGTRALGELEQQVDIVYVRKLHSDCDSQDKMAKKKIATARTSGNKTKLDKARKTPKPACQEMERIRNKHPAIFRAASFYAGF